MVDTVLITGASQGIGLEFAKQYAARDWTVIATHRRSVIPNALAQLAEDYPLVRIERMDVTDAAQIEALGTKLKGMPIDVLLNNAGLRFETRPPPRMEEISFLYSASALRVSA